MGEADEDSFHLNSNSDLQFSFWSFTWCLLPTEGSSNRCPFLSLRFLTYYINGQSQTDGFMKIVNVNSAWYWMGCQSWALPPFWHNSSCTTPAQRLEKWAWPGPWVFSLPSTQQLPFRVDSPVLSIHPGLHSTKGNYEVLFNTSFSPKKLTTYQKKL